MKRQRPDEKHRGAMHACVNALNAALNKNAQTEREVDLRICPYVKVLLCR